MQFVISTDCIFFPKLNCPLYLHYDSHPYLGAQVLKLVVFVSRQGLELTLYEKQERDDAAK